MSRFSIKFLRRVIRSRYRLRDRGSGKPRLSVFRSGRHIYAQIIDDVRGVTLCSASTLEKIFASAQYKTSGCAAATEVGRLLAGKATAIGIREVVFDRGGYKYHGRVRALAGGARGGGLKF